MNDAAIQAIQTLRTLLGYSDSALEYSGEDRMINSPNGDLLVQVYTDAEGRRYFYDPLRQQVVEVDGRQTLPSLSAPTAPFSAAELRAKAAAIAQAVIPNFAERSTALTYEEDNKGENTFFTWRDMAAPATFMKPFLQIALTQNGIVFAFYNTLSP
jgi:hypothetical protein